MSILIKNILLINLIALCIYALFIYGSTHLYFRKLIKLAKLHTKLTALIAEELETIKDAIETLSKTKQKRPVKKAKEETKNDS